MSGVGFWEFILLFGIGLMFLGPERLPRVASQIGRWVGRARRMANQLRYQLEREIALADIEEKKKDKKKPPSEASESGSRRAESPDGADVSGTSEKNSDRNNDDSDNVVDVSIAGDSVDNDESAESDDEARRA